MHLAIVVSKFNEFITEPLLKSALEECDRRHIADPSVYRVPGAFEIPIIAKLLAQKKAFDAIVCLGAVIRGDTSHYDYVCAEAARGIAQVGYDFGLPVIFGVLTTDTVEQANERIGKGAESVVAALDLVKVIRSI